jgi:hypothetical protein
VRFELGEDFYIFKASNAARTNKLIISSHGGRKRRADLLTVPPWTKLVFYTPDGVELPDPGPSSFMRWGAARYPVHEINNNPDAVYNYELSKFQGRHNDNRGENYASLQANLDEVATLTADIHAQIAEARAALVDYQARNFSAGIAVYQERLTMLLAVRDYGAQYDILTVRNRRLRLTPVTLLEVLRTLQRHGHLQYTEIHCLFCRSII